MNSRLGAFLRPGAFRLSLAFAVLVSHSGRFDPGAWAVYTFFILSGFWIHRMWSRKYCRADAPALVFLASRFLRLLPAFWIANLISAAVSAGTDPRFLSGSAASWHWLPALVSNFAILGYSSMPHSQGALNVAWSLDVEIQFYIAFAALMALSGGGRPLGMRHAILAAACAAGLAFSLLRDDPGPRNLDSCGLFFVIGVIAESTRWKPSPAATSLLIGATAAAVAILWAEPGWRFLIENEKHGATAVDDHHKRIAQAVLALLTAPVALYSANGPSDPKDRSLGDMAYVVYLVHWPIMALHTHFFASLPPLRRLPSILVAWLAVAAVSLAMYRWLECPLERLRRRWVSGHLPAYPAGPRSNAG